MQRLRLIVRGRVQGVGFRHFVWQEALRLNLAGWVRNLADGAVEIEAEGDAAALAAFDAAVRRGPVGARITACDHAWSEGPRRHRRFAITA